MNTDDVEERANPDKEEEEGLTENDILDQVNCEQTEGQTQMFGQGKFSSRFSTVSMPLKTLKLQRFNELFSPRVFAKNSK